jgi:predicted metal-dependent hydrolase
MESGMPHFCAAFLIDRTMNEISYTVIRSRRKTVSLEITRDLAVVVRAPLTMSQGEIDRFVASREAWLREHYARQQQRLAAHPEPTADQTREYIQKANAILPEKVRHYSQLMGLYPQAVTVTGAKTRFGSCSGKNRICFSWRLMAYPEEAIDYVVVHELAHIRYKNHSRDFYALIARYLPDYRERERLLKG